MIKKFLWLIFVFAVCFGFTGLAQAKLVAYYPFDGDINDASGNGKHGVFWSHGSSTGYTPNFVTGKAGQAIWLQGYESYDSAGVGTNKLYEGVIFPDESYFDVTDEITLCAWVKWDSPACVNDQSNLAPIVAKGAIQEWQMVSHWHQAASSSRYQFRVEHETGNTSLWIEYDNPIPQDPTPPYEDIFDPDIWYHCVVTYDWSLATNNMKLYLNGEFNYAITSSQPEGTARKIYDRSNCAASVGVNATNAYTPDTSRNSIIGSVDDVAIFDVALTDDEIAGLYEAGYVGNSSLLTIKKVESDGSTDVAEGGAGGPTTDSYTIVLNMLPSGSDTISVVPIYDANQITVSPNPIVLGNGSTEPNTRVVTVTVVDDDLPEGDHITTIQHSVTCDDDPSFNLGVKPFMNVVVNIMDNDYRNIVIAKADSNPFELWEDGPGATFGPVGKTYASQPAESTETYTVKLGAQPSGTVTVTISSDDGDAYGNPSELTFGTSDWYATQSVELHATNDVTTFDGFVDTTNIEFQASGGGFTDANAKIENADVFDGSYVENILGTSSASISEGIYLSDIGDGSSGAGVVLWGGWGENTPDYNQAPFAAGWQGKFKVTDANKMVKVTTRFGFAVGTGITSNYVCEVVLLVDDVRYGDSGTIDPNLSLLERNTPQSGSGGVPDDWQNDVRYIPILSNADPNHTVTLGSNCSGYYNTPGAGSKDTYTGLAIQEFKLEVMNTNEIGIMQTLTPRPTGGAAVPPTYVNEQGTTTDKYSVVLTKAPAGNVTITVSPDPNVQVDKASLTFTTGNWYVPQTVTVTAVNDSALETDPHNVNITHSASGYSSVMLNVAVADNDNRGVTFVPMTLAVSENGPTTDDYTVVLTGAPYGGNAVLTLSYDSDQVTVNPTALTFTSGDWMNAQTVVVTAVDDDVFESEIGATHPSMISGSFAGGLYNSIVPSDVTVNITDNEPYCGMPNTPYMESDISGPEDQPDCYIDLYDLMKMAELWLGNYDPAP